MMHGFGSLWMVFLWLLVIVAVIFIVKALTSGKATANTGQKPLEALKTRYASGEITREEYRQLLADINSS